MNGLVIAAPASGSGKTVAALGLISALKRRQIKACAAKTGPDYIDSAWLARAAGSPCLNLDTWMCQSSEDLIQIAKDFSSDAYLVVEGAMGLFDGVMAGSSASLACLLDLPVLLVIDARGMAQTCAAIALGCLSYRPSGLTPRFCGLICSHVGSPRHRRLLTEALEPVCEQSETPLIGFLPRSGAPGIPSRHLGLIQAFEANPDYDQIGDWFESNCNCDLLLSLTNSAESESETHQALAGPRQQEKSFNVRIAIAQDEAFQFCYADLPQLLNSLGARVTLFSPLRDARAPDCDGVYLPGGYPELYAKALSENTLMLASLRALAQSGVPVYGECGGYIYLMEGLRTEDGELWPMLNLLPGIAQMGHERAALGYRKAYSRWLAAGEIKGHEFHYVVSSENAFTPLWDICDSEGASLGPSGCLAGNVGGSWLHLYPAGSRLFWQEWLDLCRREKACRK